MENSFVLAVTANNNYKEIRLPVLNNADYELRLPAADFGFTADMVLRLEAVDGRWSFKPDESYRIQCEDASFENRVLGAGQILTVTMRRRDRASILVWDAPEKLTAFRKYRLCRNTITIGKEQDNDICYNGQRVVSAYHAEISLQGAHAYIRDMSVNGTFLDGRRVSGTKELTVGQMISIYGLTIVFLGDVLAVNSLGEAAVISQSSLSEIFPEEPDTYAEDHAAQGDTSEHTIHISPRAVWKIYDEEETIESAPQKQTEDKKPAWMSILPSLTMALPMVLGFLLMSGGMQVGIVIAVGAAVVGFTWAVINYRYTKKKYRTDELYRLQRYEQYLVQCTDIIREKYENNRFALLSMYPDAKTVSDYTAYSPEMWARRRQNSDFLYARLGLGEMPFQVKINVPKKVFSLVEDELAERPEKIARSYEVLRDVPLGVDIRSHNVIGILADGNWAAMREIARVLVAQISANHSYTDVKLAFLYNRDRPGSREWDFVRWLPHVWNEDRSMRFVACEPNGTADVIHSLGQILRGREEKTHEFTAAKTQEFLPHYVIFVEDPSILEATTISKYLYEGGSTLGVTTVILSGAYEDLPSACDYVIEYGQNFQGTYATQETDPERNAIQFDGLSLHRAEEMARRMSAMRVNQIEVGSDIPNSLTFFDMLGVRSLSEINVLDHWRKNRTYETMQAVIGQKMGGQDCYLDINEKYHGPHGLVAGTTGSGKSETLQTYILSLACNFSPLDVGFFIIDFKGGGMANLFSDLPHTIGQISNLSGNQVRRAMVSIKSENMRRERIFGEYGVKNIDEYTRLVKSGEATTPIPHMLIIIDEFAELKREQPDFMRELISVAAIGRSLGVHLILATQKPSGTVDDNIWSNTRFKLCLRVADKQDSNDMLHRPDAAYLTQAGRCYLQVGNDEIFEQFQSGWSGAVYDESGAGVRSSAYLLDLQGRETISAAGTRSKARSRKQKKWIEQVVAAMIQTAADAELALPAFDIEARAALAASTVTLLNAQGVSYPMNQKSLQPIELMAANWPKELIEPGAIADALISLFEMTGKKLPEQQEVTQLNAVVRYLQKAAEENGFINRQMLWMPLLPRELALDDLAGWHASSFRNGAWPEHSDRFQLATEIGLVDDPENQMQYPITVNLAEKGHLALVGGVTSGKSTFLQSLIFGLIASYSPAELNVYAIDYSSQMLAAFEGDAHVGGVVLEGEDDKLDKLFVMINEILARRKAQIRGGSFAQYLRMHGKVLPAIVLVIDGYANFNEKSESKYESTLLELSRSAEGYGIYLVISCSGFGGGDLQTKIANNMRQSICLELGEKYRYGEALHTMHFDVLPEENVKGRGLALLDGRVLEFQTALSHIADNDYMRSEKIREACSNMSAAWTGKRAAQIPAIPEKPLWDQFAALESYRLTLESGTHLPAAYLQESAAVYAVDLRKTFCYLVLGSEKSGISTYLRNLMCAAHDLGAETRLIDTEQQADRSAANLCGRYASTPEELFDVVKELIDLTNERAQKRRELRSQDPDNDELWAQMSESFPPVFYFISNLKDFLDRVYAKTEGIGKLSGWIENIFDKGRYLNIYFFAGANVSQLGNMMDKRAYLSFLHDKNGVLLGGELNRQTVFGYQNIRYNDQSKRFKPGIGYAMDQEDEQNVQLIVIPNNKRRSAT